MTIIYRLAENQYRPVAGVGNRSGPPPGRCNRYVRWQLWLWQPRRQPRRSPSSFIVSQDPVKLGLVTSVARPGGNATGINFFTGELLAKRLELLREIVPRAARIAVFINPATTTTEATLR